MDLTQFREYCLSKARATESTPFGPDVLVFKVGGKMFALAALDEMPTRVNLKCDPDLALELRDRYEQHVDHELGMADHGALRRAARALGLLYHRPALDLSRGAGSEGARRRTAREKEPFWQMAALGTTHCGAGCALGDILAKCGLAVFPLTLFGQKIFAAWAVDYVLALGFGIFFQYFTIAPMRGLGFRDGIKAAFKADTLSLTAWQVGMYGWIAIAVFVIFGHELSKTDPIFWFMMQIAMLAGFLTSYPVNWWLLRAGIKEKM